MDHLHCVGLGAITQQLCLDSIYFSRTATDDLTTASELCDNIRSFVLLVKKLRQVIHIALPNDRMFLKTTWSHPPLNTERVMAQTCQYAPARWGHGGLQTGRVMCGIPLTEGKQASDQRQPGGLQTRESGEQRGVRGARHIKGECVWQRGQMGVLKDRANVLGCKTKAVGAVFWSG